jgi:hypothetical protein
MRISIFRAIPVKCQPDFTIRATIESSLKLVPEYGFKKGNLIFVYKRLELLL